MQFSFIINKNFQPVIFADLSFTLNIFRIVQDLPVSPPHLKWDVHELTLAVVWKLKRQCISMKLLELTKQIISITLFILHVAPRVTFSMVYAPKYKDYDMLNQYNILHTIYLYEIIYGNLNNSYFFIQLEWKTF